ncbi:MAG: glycosyltransferase family 2 protein [Bacteroidales bacterium]|nr:glycosyltransferase family 2 protein [Bacteroidales bacterium]
MKVSIIMSVYNTESYLRKALDSVVAQTYSDWEFIIVDDGSTDKSGEIIDTYASNDSRIKVVHKANTGQADSRNIALKMAGGEYIGYIDSDDWYEPNYIATLVEFAEKEQLDIAMCGHFIEYKNTSIVKNGDSSVKIYDRKEALNQIIIDEKTQSYLWNKLFKREMITDDFPINFFYEDYSTVFKWFMNANKVGLVEVPLYHYRQRKSSTDHLKIAEVEFHFFLADYNRFNYLIDNNIAPDLNEWLKGKFARTSLKEAKKLARLSPSYQVFKKYRTEIYSKIKKYLTGKAFPFRKRFRLLLFVHFPALYYLDMKVGRFSQSLFKSENTTMLYD